MPILALCEWNAIQALRGVDDIHRLFFDFRQLVSGCNQTTHVGER